MDDILASCPEGSPLRNQANSVCGAGCDDKDALCEDNEVYSKELDACVTGEEAAQIIDDDGSRPNPVPTPAPPSPAPSPNNGNQTTETDLSKTTLLVIAIMTVGILILFAMGIMIGQNCTQNKDSRGDVHETNQRSSGQASQNVELTSTNGEKGLPRQAPGWKEDNGSEFISTNLSPKKDMSSVL